MKNQPLQRVGILLLGLAAALGASSPTRSAEAMEIRMLLVSGPGNEWAQHRAGAELGVSEGNIQGRFLGINYALVEQSPEQVVAVDSTSLPAAVIVAGEENLLRQVQAAWAPHGVPVFNIALADDALRAECLEGVFHTPPSERMLADAVAQWQQNNPGAQVTAMAWHPAFVKFAGRDLNRRFSEQFDRDMDSDAWAGWAATRSVAEAVVRTMSAEPAVIAAYLRNDLAFDGQKGVAHSYRVTGQLRQTLLIAANGNLLGEAPVRGVAADTDLDTLGITECR